MLLSCVVCFFIGCGTTLLLTKQNDPEPVRPIVNVYITVPEEIAEDVSVEVEESVEKPWTEEDAVLLAKMCYGESRGVPMYRSKYGDRSNSYQNACCMWTVLNRVDAGWGTIEEVVTADQQFIGYKASNPVDDELLNLAYEVLGDWSSGAEQWRTLPSDYLYFRGDGTYNYFRKQDGTKYDWSLPDPFV